MEENPVHRNFICLEGKEIAWASDVVTIEELRGQADWDDGVDIVLEGEPDREVHVGECFDLRLRPHFRRRVILILVNHREVRMRRRVATGIQIKEEAIAQGVAVRLDFALFKVDGDKLMPIKDAEAVRLHEREEFRCVAPDDNS